MKNIKLIIFIIILICAACSQLQVGQSSEYITPDSETYLSLMPIVREYFYYRKQAVLNGDMTDFYQRYPDLAYGTDIEQGINFEGFHVENLAGLEVFDGNNFPEYYENLRIKKDVDEIQIKLHGMELYLWEDSEGKFKESGGEFKIVLFLRREWLGWEIYKTDEVTLQEWKDQ